jgi:DUF917 family protein
MKESFLKQLGGQLKRDYENGVIDEEVYKKWDKKIREAKKEEIQKVFEKKKERAILKGYIEDVKRCSFKPGWEEKGKEALPGEEWRNDLIKIIELKELRR